MQALEKQARLDSKQAILMETNICIYLHNGKITSQIKSTWKIRMINWRAQKKIINAQQ